MSQSELASLLDELPERPADCDRTIVFVAIDTPSNLNPDLSGVGSALHGALTAAGVDPATQVKFLAYTLDVEEASEGWRTGDRLAPEADPS